jgi:hypothetical protein
MKGAKAKAKSQKEEEKKNKGEGGHLAWKGVRNDCSGEGLACVSGTHSLPLNQTPPFPFLPLSLSLYLPFCGDNTQFLRPHEVTQSSVFLLLFLIIFF